MAAGSDERFSTVAGWTSPYGDGTLLLYLHPVPRPYGYLVQLRRDIRGYKPWLLWLGGGGLIVLGLALVPSHQAGGAPVKWPLWLVAGSVIAGLLMLLRWLAGFVHAVHRIRTAPLGVGVVRALLPRPPWPDLAFADAVGADGTVTRVTLARAVVARFLDAYGECEVLFLSDGRPPRAGSDTGFAFAARAIWSAGTKAGGPAFQWSALSEAKRTELAEIAHRASYPVDAVFFIVFALTTAPRLKADGEREGRHVTGQDLCRFVSESAARMFGGPAAGAQALSAWGLRTGDDVGAIVAQCVRAGWMRAAPDDRLEDFKGLEILPK